MSLWSFSSNTGALWQTGNSENSTLLKDNNINTNWKYRSFMVNNADKIIKTNQSNACEDIGLKSTVVNKINGENNSPFLYKSFTDYSAPTGYNTSDAKDKYMLDVSQEKQMINPIIPEKKITIGGYLRNLF